MYNDAQHFVDTAHDFKRAIWKLKHSVFLTLSTYGEEKITKQKCKQNWKV